MKRIVLVTLACAALVLGLALAASAASGKDAPGKPVEMKFPGDGAKYAPIMFPHHAQHLAVKGGCETCHHKWDGKGEIKACASAGCHDDTSKANKKQPTSYDSAFHTRDSGHSCVGCHTAQLKENPASKAPKKCNECHSKK